MAKSRMEEWETPEKLFLLQSWAQDGLTDEEIAARMGINARTLYRWKNTSSPICQSLKDGKEVADYEVQNALRKRALGFEKDGKYFPPDVTAQIFWLKNRNPERWRDKQDRNNDEEVRIIDNTD